VLVTSRSHFNVIRAPGTNISLAFLFYEKYFSHQKHRNDTFEIYKRGQKLENLKKSFVVLKNMRTGLLLNLFFKGKNKTSIEAGTIKLIKLNDEIKTVLVFYLADR
jgi:hypothetical protein